MNARQKAKHFKMLYEMGLPKKPYPVVYKSVLPTRYKVQAAINMSELTHLMDSPQLIKSLIEQKVLKELRPLIWEHLKIDKGTYFGMYICDLDIYFNPQESGDSKETLLHIGEEIL